MGAALAEAAVVAGHAVSLLLGHVSVAFPAVPPERIEHAGTAAEMQAALKRLWPGHDVLVMAAAVADYRPAEPSRTKLPRTGELTLKLVANPDLVAEAAAGKRADQHIVAFSLEQTVADAARAVDKMRKKRVDLMVFNTVCALGVGVTDATLLWPDGRSLPLGQATKRDTAARIIDEVARL